MESKRNSNRTKSKINRATKPSSTGKPKSSEFVANQPTSSPSVGYIIVNQDQVFLQQNPKVAFVVPDRNGESYGKLENLYGGGAVEDDEAVDAKAARYISSVQERFRLEFGAQE